MSLGLTSRRLVAAARTGLDPAPDVAARVRAKVAAAITGAPPVSAPAAVGVGKLLVLGAIVSAIGVWFVAPRAATPAPTIAIPVTAAVEEAPQLAVHVTSSSHADPPPIARKPPVAAIVRAPEIVMEPPAPPTLAREIELVDSAMASLRTGDLAKTLSTLDVYEYETTGHGQLAEDAAALEIEARCRSRMEITDKLAVFDQRWPHSVQRTRITTACSDR